MGAKLDDVWYIARSLTGLAVVSAETGQFERAAWLLGAIELRSPAGNILDADFYDSIRVLYEGAVEAAQHVLGAAAFAAAWQRGRELPPQQAVIRALADLEASGETPAGGIAAAAATYDLLTPREAEVLRLLVQRQTDREIADALYISPRTVHSHLARILAKLEVKNRREAGAAAVRLGYV